MKLSTAFAIATLLSSAAFAQETPQTYTRPAPSTATQPPPSSSGQTVDIGAIFDKLNTSHTGKLLATLPALRHAAFSPSGDRIVTISSDNIVCIWDMRTSVAQGALDGHRGAVQRAQFHC